MFRLPRKSRLFLKIFTLNCDAYLEELNEEAIKKPEKRSDYEKAVNLSDDITTDETKEDSFFGFISIKDTNKSNTSKSNKRRKKHLHLFTHDNK